MWHLKPPLLVGAPGKIKKSSSKHLQQIPGKSSLTEIQKIVLTSSARILRTAMSI